MDVKKRIVCTVVLTSEPVFFDDGTTSGNAADLMRNVALLIEGCPHYSDGYSFDLSHGNVKASVSIKSTE